MRKLLTANYSQINLNRNKLKSSSNVGKKSSLNSLTIPAKGLNSIRVFNILKFFILQKLPF